MTNAWAAAPLVLEADGGAVGWEGGNVAGGCGAKAPNVGDEGGVCVGVVIGIVFLLQQSFLNTAGDSVLQRWLKRSPIKHDAGQSSDMASTFYVNVW
jgi:hypothetical protein